MVGYLYSITHVPTGQIYIGSTEDVHRRFRDHKYMLLKNKHHNFKLQKLWNCSLESDFSFCILKTAPVGTLRAMEEKLIREIGNLNIAIDTSSPTKGRLASSETRAKISKIHKGKSLSEDTKKRISTSRKGKYGGSKNPSAKLSEEDIIKIRMMYKNTGKSQKKIGEMFGVSQQTVSAIINCLTWTQC